MKKLILLLLLLLLLFYSNCFFASESKLLGRSVTPWAQNENKLIKSTNQLVNSKTIQTPVDSCPVYQVYTKKVVTASSRGEIENTGWILKEEYRSCDPVDTKEKRISYDISYIRQGDPDEEMITTEVYEKNGCATCFNCADVVKAGVTKHKINFHLLNTIRQSYFYIKT